MLFLLTRLPIILLQRVEEQIPAVREIMVSSVCLCADKRIISAYFGNLCGPKYKMFSMNLMLLSFSVVSDFKDDFLCPWGGMYVVALVVLACSFLTCW